MGISIRLLFTFLFAIISTSQLFALELVDLSSPSEKDKDPKTRGNWFMATGLRYENASNEFSCPATNCTQASIEPDDAIDLFGGEIRIGRELSIGGVFSLILSLDAFYHNTQDETGIKPDDTTVDVFVSESAIKTQYMGFGGTVGLGLFPFKLGNFIFLPVIEFGAGSGSSEKSAKYYYDNTQAINEYYEAEYNQDFSYTKLGAGINIIASSGIYAYIRFHSTNYEFESTTGKEKFGGRGIFLTENNPAPNDTNIPASSESVITTTLGFGYRF